MRSIIDIQAEALNNADDLINELEAMVSTLKDELALCKKVMALQSDAIDILKRGLNKDIEQVKKELEACK